MPIAILVVTGASGAGKTSAVSALASLELPGVRCFHFDAIGVPTPEVMHRDYGGPEEWQAWATREWLGRLTDLDGSVRVAVLDAQTRPATVLTAAGAGTTWHPHVVLFDCAHAVRSRRLCEDRGQPELDTEQMISWAHYLRDQAIALNLPIIETTYANLAEVTHRLRALVETLVTSNAPAP